MCSCRRSRRGSARTCRSSISTRSRGGSRWKSLNDGFEVSTSKLGMTTQGGLALQPVDLQLRVFHAARAQTGARRAVTRMRWISSRCGRSSDHLPFDAELRKQLETYAPRGSCV